MTAVVRQEPRDVRQRVGELGLEEEPLKDAVRRGQLAFLNCTPNHPPPFPGMSSAPIVIPYAKTCNEAIGRCVGSAGAGGTFVMQITSFRPTGSAAQLTATETITVGGISFTAEMNGHVSPAGFIVLNGTDGGLVRGRAGPPAKQPCRPRRADDVVDRRAPTHAGECMSRITMISERGER